MTLSPLAKTSLPGEVPAVTANGAVELTAMSTDVEGKPMAADTVPVAVVVAPKKQAARTLPSLLDRPLWMAPSDAPELALIFSPVTVICCLLNWSPP